MKLTVGDNNHICHFGAEIWSDTLDFVEVPTNRKVTRGTLPKF
jgi:hypothetical protein